MAIYEITTPRPGYSPYTLSGSFYVGGPPPTARYGANDNGALVGWWRLNEDVSSSGDVTDSSNTGNTGTFAGSTNRPAYSLLTPSIKIQDSSNTFDGGTDYFEIGAASTWNSLIGSPAKISIAGWINPEVVAIASQEIIIQFGNQDIELMYWGTSPYGDKLNIKTTWSSGVYWSITEPDLTPARWTHFVLTMDLGSYRTAEPVWYLDGVQVANKILSTPPGEGDTFSGITTSTCTIGGKASGDHFLGGLADIAVWNKVLNPADVTAIYTAAVAKIYTTYRNYDIKGSIASPSGSQYDMMRQGINADTAEIYFGSMIPRIGSGDRFAFFKNGKRLPAHIFDDTSLLNNDLQDMGGENDDTIQERIDFLYENRNLGQPKTWQEGEPYGDLRGFNPIAYILDEGEVMWPVNLWNAGQLPKHEFDGVIEPLDIRSELYGFVDSRYEGHAIRGSLGGSAGEGPLGSREITDVWKIYDPQPTFFLDGPEQFGFSLSGSNNTPHNRPSELPNFREHRGNLPLQAFQNLEFEDDYPFVEKDYHDIVYASLLNHNSTTNKGSFSTVVDPTYSLTGSWTSNTGDYKYSGDGWLIAWWRFATSAFEPSGPEADASAFNLTGSFYAAPVTPDFSANTPSAYIQPGSADFTETSPLGYMWAPGNNNAGRSWNNLVGGSYALGSMRPWSISLWVRPTAFPGSPQTLVTIGKYGAQSSISLFIINTTTPWIKVQVANSTPVLNYAQTDPTATPLLVDTWYHIVVTYRGTFNAGVATEQFEIYVNGVSSKDAEYNHGNAAAAPTGIVGNHALLAGYTDVFDATAGYPFQGYMADVAIWNRNLPTTSILALYHASISGVTADATESWVQKDSDMSQALILLNGSSCNTLTDPLDVRGNHGFYFGKKAGSITFGDV